MGIHMDDEDIIQLCNKEQTTFRNTSFKHCGIFTNNEQKADILMKYLFDKYSKLNIVKSIKFTKQNKELTLKNGIVFKWLNFYGDTRGFHCEKAFIDENICFKELQTYILPILCNINENDITLF